LEGTDRPYFYAPAELQFWSVDKEKNVGALRCSLGWAIEAGLVPKPELNQPEDAATSMGK
jgi:hypothetical protein